MTETRPVRKHYSHALADVKKAKKRTEAKARQAERDKRTTKQQIAKLNAGSFVAKRERKKLEN